MKSLGYNLLSIRSYIEANEKKLDTVLKVKKFTSFCNSVSIKLVQMEKYQNALEICNKGISASRSLSQSNQGTQMWPGRILAFCIESFALYKLNKFAESLKFLYESQLLLQTSKETFGPFCLELYILSNYLTYMSLWKIGRKPESFKYLEIVKINVTSIRKGKILSKYPRVSIENFHGILCYSFSIAKVELEGNYKEAKIVSEEALNELGDDVMARSLINSLLMSMKNVERNPYSVVESEIGKELEDIFFISIFLPMMSPNVPDIKVTDKYRKKGLSVSKRSSGSSGYEVRGNGVQYSPSSRPKSGLRTESPSLTLMRPRSSYGNYMQRKLKK